MSLPSVFVIGDSISVQYGPFLAQYLGDAWHYARTTGEEEALRDLDLSVGANAGNSVLVLTYLKAVIETIEADLLLVNCGLHDIKRQRGDGTIQVPVDDYCTNLQDIIALCMERHQDLAWIRTTPIDEDLHNRLADFDRFAADAEEYNAVADQVMLENGIPMMDLHGFTANCGGSEIYRDHVHFTELVQQQQAAFIAGWLDAWLACRLR